MEHKQLYYSVSINKYRVHINTADGPKSVSMWATDEGLKEYIEINHVEHPDIPATYKVTKIGTVQKGQPIPQWKP